MLNKIKKLIRPLLPQQLLNKIRILNEEKQFKNWVEAGSPVPPPHIVKQKIISQYQQQSKYTVLVETGTFLGDMVEAQKKNFKKIYSIELAEYYYLKSKNRFRNNPTIEIIKGDSGTVLIELLAKIQTGTIFWLDGHYSHGMTAKAKLNCPIFEELSAIFLHQQSLQPIILIDDARLFIGENDYPTIEDLQKFVLSKNNTYQMKIEDDIIKFIVSK